MSTLSFPIMEDDNNRSRRSSSSSNNNSNSRTQMMPILTRSSSHPAAASAKSSMTQQQRPPPSPCPFSPCQFSVEIEHSFSCDNLQLSMKAPCTSSQSPNKPWSLAMKPSTTTTTTTATSSYEHHDQQQTSPHFNTGVEFPLHHEDTHTHRQHKVPPHHCSSNNQQRDRDQDREDAENYASSEEDMVSRMRPTMMSSSLGAAAGPGVQLQLQYDDQHSPSSNTSHNSRLSPRVGPRIEQLDLGGDSGGGAITPLPYNNARLSPRIAPRIDDDQFGSSSAITPLPNRLSPGRMHAGDQQAGEMTPNLLNPFISLTPGVPQNHHPQGGGGHHQQHQQPPHPMYQQKPCHRRNNSLTLIISTPQRKHRRQISIDVANQHAHQQQLQLQQTTSHMNNNINTTGATATSTALMTNNTTTHADYDENAFAVHLGSPPPPSGDMNCMYDCFGITDFTHLFCPQTPIISTIEQTNTTTTTANDPYACDLLTCEDVSRGLEYFPSAIQEYQSSVTHTSHHTNGELGLVGLQEFWANTVSPDNSPIRRNRNDLLYDETNHLPKNRSHKQRRRHVQQLMEVWYAHDTNNTNGVAMVRSEEENRKEEEQKKEATSVVCGKNELNQSHDDFGLDLNDMILNRVPYHPYQNDYNSRRRVSQHERSCLAWRDPRQQRCCYDSDPEQEYRGRKERRRAVLLIDVNTTSTTPASLPRRTKQTTTASQPPTTKQVLQRNDDDDDDDLDQVAAVAYGLEEHLKQLELDRTKVEEELQQRLEALDLVDDPAQQEQQEQEGPQQPQQQQDRTASSSSSSSSSKKVVQHQPRFRNFRPAPFTHLDTDEETEDDSSHDDEKEKVEQQQHDVSTSSVTSTSDGYQTAEDGEHESSSLDRYSEPCGGGSNSSCQIPIHPPTPRESVADKISFGFCGFSKTFSIDNTTSSDVIVVGGGGKTVPTTTAETNNKMTTTTTAINNNTTIGNDISAPNHRNLSMTSLSSIATEKGCNTSGHRRNVSLSSDVIPITGGEGENSQRRRHQHRRNVSMSSINSSTSASHNKTRQRNNKKKGGGHHRRNSSLTSISSLSQRRTQHHRRRSSTEMSFDFGKAVAAGNDGEGDEEDGSLRRNISTTSLSTTGHSRFHTIRMSRDDLDESDNSSQNASSSTSTTTSTSSIITTTTTTTGEGIGIGGGSEDTDYCCGAGTTQTSSTVIPSYMKSQSTQWTEFHLLFSKDADEELIKSHVHELSNIRFPLIWHPPPAALSANADNNNSNGSSNNNTKNKSSSSHSVSTSSAVVNSTSRKIASLFSDVSTPPPTTPTEPSNTNDNNGKSAATTTTTTCTPTPIAVYASFEVGAHLEHLVVQPKFTWTPVVQPHLTNHNAHDSNNNRLNRRELLLSESAPPQIELLSIIRVNKPPRLDRTLYPFARLDRVCCITTNDPNYPNLVLECPSEQERDWLVFSMKLIVARLASIIITRDEEMLHEFFSPYSALMQLDGDGEEDESEESGVVARVGVVVDPNDKSESSDGRSHYEEVIELKATTGEGGDRYDVVVTTNGGSSSSDNNKRGREEVSTPPRSSFTAAATTSVISAAREEEATRVVIVDDNNDEEVDYVFTAIVEEAAEEDIDSTDEDEEIVTEESDDIKDAAAAAVIIGGGGVDDDDVSFMAERDRYEYVSCHQYHDRAARRAHPSSPPPPHGVGSSSPSSSQQRSMSKTESPLRSCATTTTTTPAAAATGGGGGTTTTGVKPTPHADGMIRTFSF